MADSCHGEPIAKLKVDVHCEKCFKKFRKVLKNFQGVKGMYPDFAGHMLTVRGWVDPNDLKERIESEIHRSVEVVQPKKEEKEKKESKVRFEEKAVATPTAEEENRRDEVKKKEKEVTPLEVEEDEEDAGGLVNEKVKKKVKEVEQSALEKERTGRSYGGYPQPYETQYYSGYAAPPPPARPEFYGGRYPPSYFSDEHPNGCSVM